MFVPWRVPIKSKNLMPLRILTSFDNLGSMAHEDVVFIMICLIHHTHVCVYIYLYHAFQTDLNKFMVCRSVN